MQSLKPAGAIVDIGCGTGLPVSKTIADAGYEVYGIDPSPTLLATFQHNIPDATAACEAAETSRFFNRRFEGTVAVGLMFLLPESSQCSLIKSVAKALHPGGHFLFSAPRQICTWHDNLTGRLSRSLGEECYTELLAKAGFHLVDTYEDEGSNHYFHARAA